MRVRVWLKRLAVLIAGAIAALAILIAVIVRSEWGRGEVRQLINSQASRFLDGTFRVGHVAGSLIRGVTLTDVTFERNGEVVFAAREIDAGYSAWSLWRGGRELRFVRLIDPVIRLEEHQGHWSPGDWMKPRTSSGGPPGAPFVVADIEMINGRLLSQARESVWRLPPELHRLNGSFRLRLGGPTELTLNRFSFATPDNAFEARTATGVLTFASDETRLTGLKISGPDGALTVTGAIGASPTARPVSLNVTLDRWKTQSWKVFSPLLDSIALDATGPVVVGGTFDRTSIRATLATTAGHIVTDTIIAAQSSQVRITGTADLAAFDAEAVTGSAQWASAVTGHMTYTVVGRGTPAAWTATSTLSGGPVRAFGVDASTIDGTVTYANDLVTFDAAVTAYGADGHAAGTVTTAPTLAIDVTGDHLSHVDPRRLPVAWGFPQLDALAGASTFTAHWTSTDWTATAHLAESTIEGGTIAAGTTVQLTSRQDAVTLLAEGDMSGIDAHRLGRALQMSGLDDPLFDSRLNGHIRVSGQGRAWAEINLSGRGNLVDSDVATAHISSAEVTYTRDAHHNTARIVGGLVGLDPVKVGAPDAAEGRINGAADIIVEWRDDAAEVAKSATARGTLRLTPSIVAKLPVDRGEVAGEWRDGVFNARTIDLEGRGLHITGRGKIAINAGESAATFEVGAADIAAMEPWMGRVVHGALTARGQLRGPFDAPRITGAAESPEVVDVTAGTFTQAAATVDFTLPDWDSLKTNGPLRAQASAWTSAGGTVAHEVVVEGRLDSWTAFHGTAAARINEFLAEGTFTAEWANELGLDIAAASLTRGSDQWRVDPAGGRLRITSSRITASNVRLTNGAQSIGMDGALLIGGGELTPADRLTANATNVDLAAIDRFLGLDAQLTGRASATVALSGRLSDPRGRITVEGRDLGVRGYTIATLAGAVDLAAGAATTNVTVTQPDGVALRAIGTMPLSAVMPAGSLDASVPRPEWSLNLVTEAIELKIFGPLVPKIQDIGGQMIADVRVVGAADAPRVTGTVALADAAFRVPAAGIVLSQVTADIGFAPDLITVRRFIAKDKRGHALTITGQFAVNERQVGALNVNVEADRVSVLDNAIGSIELSALLQLSGDVGHPKLTGNVEVVNGRVEVDRLLRVLAGDPLALVAESNLPPEGETAVDLRADAARAAAAAAGRKPSAFDSKSFLSGLDADVRILAPDNLILRGSSIRPGGKDSWSLGDLNVTVGGELTATRRPGTAPKIVGDVTTIRGVYSFEGRRFEIQRGGRIRFNGDVPMDPTFDVRGIRRIEGVEARVDVRGRLSDPSLVLGSNLPLDEADILSMIIFNRPVNQLGETQRADLVGAAASLAGGFVTSPLTSSLSKALDLDLLEIETVTFGQNVAPRIRIGQQIGNRLFVQFAQQFGPQSLSELTAEYQLARFLRLQANTAQGPGSRAQRSLLQRTERFGLDLIFFFNY